MLRKDRIFVALILLALVCPVCLIRAHAQLPWESLTNREIVQMVKAKVPAAEIIAKIKSSRCHFDTTNTILDELESQGVPAEVINAMAEAPYGPPVKPRSSVGTLPVARTEATTVSSEKAKPSSEAGNTRVDTSVTPAPAPAPPVMEAAAKIPTTENLTDEITRGLTQRYSVVSSYSLITGTPAANLAQQVLAKLRATTAFKGAPDLPYAVEVIQRTDPNAFHTMGGHVFVTSGLAELLGNDAGLWAAIESHEIAHNIYRHGYRSYLRGSELQRSEKLQADDESEADKLGLLMMVEAGYHPDFAVNLIRILKLRVGDESKVVTLFSDHPGFITGQAHIRELYPQAVARFQSLWPDAEKSPGGLPPVVDTLLKASATEKKLQTKTLKP
jgi:putative metalloprotease